MMNFETKRTLATLVQEWLSADGNTQAILARKTGLSTANISHIAGNRWEEKTIGDPQWQKLVVFFKDTDHINTSNFQNITGAAKMAQKMNRVIAVDGYTGAGKSYALERYWKEGTNVFLVRARRSMGARTFMREVAKQVGIQNPGGQIYDMENLVIERIKNTSGPVLLILDEVEYLKPLALDSVKVLIQELEGVCGIIVSGIIKDWLEKLAARKVQGMPQFLRRVGHSWVIMKGITNREIRGYARDHGITDKVVLDCLCRDVRDYGMLKHYVGDLVRVSQANGVAIDAELYAQLFHDNRRSYD